jgi:hypothetical protein
MHSNGQGSQSPDASAGALGARAAPELRAPTWRAEDFTALAEYLSPIWIDIFEGARPPILIDPRGYDAIAFQGDVANPLIATAIAAYEALTQRNLNRAQDVPTPPIVDVGRAAAEARDLQDKFLAAVIVAPPYAAGVRDGRPPAGHLWYSAFTADQRRRLTDFFYNGAEALKSVRRAPDPHAHAKRDGGGVSSAAEQHSDPASAGLPPLVAGRGSPASSGTSPPGGAGGAGGGADPGGRPADPAGAAGSGHD